MLCLTKKEVKMECVLCNKMIDDDSLFCKYCGAKVVEERIRSFYTEKLCRIFQRTKETLVKNSKYTSVEFDKEFDSYKHYQNKNMEDNDYYKILVDIIFYSGFKASTVDKYLDTIHAYFSDYKVAMNYSDEQAEQIKNDSKMIKNKAKIYACIKNAIKIAEIVKEHKSVAKYIKSFEPEKSDEGLIKLKKSLERDFSFLGGVTSYHFMTDIGLNVLKPDRVISRIFYRLGLIKDENDLFETVKVGRAFSVATGLPVRYIDIIFVTYGQLNQEKIECICSEKNPKCKICGIIEDCKYAKSQLNFDET